MKKLIGLFVLVFAFLIGVGMFMFIGKASSSSTADNVDLAILSLQDAVLRDPLAKYDPEKGDYYRSWETYAGGLNITVGKGEYTLLTIKTKETEYLEVIELDMDGKVISGFGRSFKNREIQREFIAPSSTEVGKGEEYRQHYEQLAEKFKPIFFSYFGVDPTGDKWGI